MQEVSVESHESSEAVVHLFSVKKVFLEIL